MIDKKFKLIYTAENNKNLFIQAFNYFVCYIISILLVFTFLYLSYKDIVFPSWNVTLVHINNIFVFSSKVFINIFAIMICFSKVSNHMLVSEHCYIKENGKKAVGEILSVKEEKIGLFLFKCYAVVQIDSKKSITIEGILRNKAFKELYKTHGPNNKNNLNKPQIFVDVYSMGLFDNFVDLNSAKLESLNVKKV